jgi:hypothetical protein
VAVSEMENGACLDLDWEVYYGHDVHLTPGPGVNGSKQTIPPELCIAPGIRDYCSLMCLFLWAACRWPPNPPLSPIHFPSRLPASPQGNCCSMSAGPTNLHATPACTDFRCASHTHALSTPSVLPSNRRLGLLSIVPLRQPESCGVSNGTIVP